MKNFTAIVLAAGKGVRMKSNLPKVLHELNGKPLIGHVLGQLKKIKAVKQVIVVTGYKANSVEAYIRKNFKGVNFARQQKLRGTADAVRCAANRIKYDNVLILCADAPLLTAETFFSLLSLYEKQSAKCAVISAHLEENNDLGRIIRDASGSIKAICEKQDLIKYLSTGQSLREVNSGIYAFDRCTLLENIARIKKNEKKGEYFFTDIIEILYQGDIPIESCLLSNNDEILGINSRKELLVAEKILNKRTIERLICDGVDIIDPQTTFIKNNVKIGKNTLIYPFTFIEKDVIIGSHCRLGPFIHLREGTRIDDNVSLGNFVEVCRSKVGKTTRIRHFSYIGYATIGTNVNIGAGTVVANYDGKNKNKTRIGNNAFIGSDSVLVAPINIGNSAVTGAGSVVRKNVGAKTVVVGVPAKFLKKSK
jgi:bifunctional UDP-N-acetylglucosamine pyrophosphorylase/glucosamine-1-phosphate N-acetyltransferase